MKESTTLYRLYDADGGLLYIGIAGNPGRRFEQHAGDKPWWGQVARTELAHYPTRAEALDAERAAIASEGPLHNVVHSLLPPEPRPPRPELPEFAPLTPEDAPAFVGRALDNPAKLARAADIVRAALARNNLTLADLQATAEPERAPLPDGRLAFSLAEVTQFSGVPRWKLNEHLYAGSLKARKLGRKVIILRADLERFLEAHG